MRTPIIVLTAVSFALAGCAAGPGQGTGSSSQSGVDPTIAALGCGVVGGVVGSQFGQGQGRIVGGVIGAIVGAGFCSWLASRSFNQLAAGQSECRSEGGAEHCLRNEPVPPADQCVQRVQVVFADTGEDAWRCTKANGAVDYYPV